MDTPVNFLQPQSKWFPAQRHGATLTWAVRDTDRKVPKLQWRKEQAWMSRLQSRSRRANRSP
jgi:hypothetical protein